MNNVFAVIIEDEKPAARLLKSMIDKIRPEWQTQIIANSVRDSIKWFEENPHPDLIFLDIHLSDGSSFDFLNKAHPKSTVIFTTAYDEYAIQAFQVNSIDYILKPVHSERLLEAVEKYEHLCMSNSSYDQEYLNNILECISQSATKRYRSRFLICGSNNYTTLLVEDIAYFYSENRITTAVTKDNKEMIVDFTLDKLGEQLDPDKFFRANRQYIICADVIKRVEPYFNNTLTVHTLPASKSSIRISRDKLLSFKAWLDY